MNQKVSVLKTTLLLFVCLTFAPFTAFAVDADLSSYYTAAADIYETATGKINSASNRQNEIVNQLDRASTFLAANRKALVSNDGFLVSEDAPRVLMGNRDALSEMLSEYGYTFSDYLKTMTIRIPQNYSLNYGTFSIERATMQNALNLGFTDLIFQNDLFSVRLSLVDYLGQVPGNVTTLKYFVGEPTSGIPKAVSEIAGSNPILSFREYRDGALVSGVCYDKNAVAVIVNSAMYGMSGYKTGENLFFKFQENPETVSLVNRYLYSSTTQTASFALEDGNYFILLPKKSPAKTYAFSGTGFGVYDVSASEDLFQATLFFEDVGAAGSAVVCLAFYDTDGNVLQVKTCEATLKLGEVPLSFSLEDPVSERFSLFIWRSIETARPLFEKINGTVKL